MITATRVRSNPPTHSSYSLIVTDCKNSMLHKACQPVYEAEEGKGLLDAQAESRPLSTQQRTDAALRAANVGKEACPTTTPSQYPMQTKHILSSLEHHRV